MFGAVRIHEVEGKFRVITREYEDFRKQYGQRLESQWNAISEEINFGKPGEKYVRVNAMLDALRREMRRERAGG